MALSTPPTPDNAHRHRQNSPPPVRPFRIAWQGKSYEVNNFDDYYTARENGQQMHVFTATDGEGTFELKFTAADMEWFLGN